MKPSDDVVTELLASARVGDDAAQREVVAATYDELRTLASRVLRRERRGHTLQTTALVHEAYLRLAKARGSAFASREHFFALAARTLRRVLVDHARARAARKRRGDSERISVETGIDAGPSLDLVALDEALERLERVGPRQARVVDLRFFGGMSVEETARSLGVSPATVKRDWELARAWLYREIEGKTA
jgi:RNA polymerase sigma factor (TIGR02999 family)